MTPRILSLHRALLKRQQWPAAVLLLAYFAFGLGWMLRAAPLWEPFSPRGGDALLASQFLRLAQDFGLWTASPPFLLAACTLAGCLWWVARRHYGGWSGLLALSFFLFSPSLFGAAVKPNAELLAALAIYGGLYTCIGVGHALQGPRHKWPLRMSLLACFFLLAASAHLLSWALLLTLGLAMLLWIVVERRGLLLLLLGAPLAAALAALLLALRLTHHSLADYFSIHALQLTLSSRAARQEFLSLSNLGFTLALLAALAIYAWLPRARYFGNTAPLLCAALLMAIEPLGVEASPSLWAQPFLIAFLSGVFTDAFESSRGLWARAGALALAALQALLFALTLGGRI